MTNREQPDPGEGWRLASGDDYMDLRCEYWSRYRSEWIPRSCPGSDFDAFEAYYRIPVDPQPSEQPDLVNAPPHYRQGEIECIDAIRAALTTEEFRGYCKGNAIKYAWREKHKGGDEDLRKAGWYLNRIETIKTEQTK